MFVEDSLINQSALGSDRAPTKADFTALFRGAIN
jgi:hypothetical protein